MGRRQRRGRSLASASPRTGDVERGPEGPLPDAIRADQRDAAVFLLAELRRFRVAAAFFPAATRFGDFRPVDLAAVFLRVVFLAVDFFAVLFLRVVFLAVDRFAVLFLRAGFRAVVFLAIDVFRLAGFLAVVFLAVDRFLAAVFFAAIAVPLSSVPGVPLASFALATEPPNLRLYEGSCVTTPSV